MIKRLFARLVRFGLFMSLLGIFVVTLVVATAWVLLPRVEEMNWSNGKPSVTLMDQSGKIIATYGQVFDKFHRVETLPPHLVQALISIEDRRFYKHFGIDPLGIARAMYINLQAGGLRQGGSTLTQQLAKNLYFTDEHSLNRKFKEAVMALKLEFNLSKNEILSLYLNRVYFGAGTYGVEAASKRYFGKSAVDLDLYESAALAGLLKAPSRYNPARSTEQTERRTAIVLRAMVDAGYLEDATATMAIAQAKSVLQTGAAKTARSKAPYFADWVMSQVDDFVGVPGEDLVVHTTLNSVDQSKARTALAGVIEKNKVEKQAGQAALVAMDGDGAVRAMVGGKSYRESQFNRATQALRQPGSAFKLFVYLSAFEQGYDLRSPLYDGPVTVEKWSPQNYSKKFYGDVDLETAFTKSLNPATVALSEAIGRTNSQLMARRLGITTPITDHASLALGSSEGSLLELTNAYASVANGGKLSVPHGISRIETRDGRVLYHRKLITHQTIDPAVANKMRALLASVVAKGTARRASGKGVYGGKTGTSSDNRDAVFVGYTQKLVTGVWVGNDDGSPMNKVTGGSLPIDIFLNAQNLDSGIAAPLSQDTNSTFSSGIY
ncbi:MAG: transglycosylase domain-containing protein [Alphaproteobacteria bacterium]